MLQNDTNKTVMNYIYSILFGLIFTIPVWAMGHELENFMYLIVYILIILAMVDVAAEWVGHLKEKKQNAVVK